MAFAFEKLNVYQKSISFADAVCTLTKEFPRGYFFLANQLNRAGFVEVAAPVSLLKLLLTGRVVKTADNPLSAA